MTMTLDEAIQHCEEKSCGSTGCADEHRQLGEWLNELKELRSQNTWKPSEEQIGVIEAVINNRSFQRRHLDSLYADLKKLREE